MDLRKVEAKIEKMLQVLVEDLIKGVEQDEAGYRTSDTFNMFLSEQREFLRLGIIERNSRGMVRFSFKNKSIRQKLKKFDLQLDQIDCLLDDTKKFEKAKKFLYRIIEIAQKYPENWKFIIGLGWWKMLEVSEMPAKVDDILGEGFSPKDWMIKAPRSSSQLALNVARKYGRISDFKEVINFLEKMETCKGVKIALPLIVAPEDVQRVMKILKWNEIGARLNDSVIKMLAFPWAFLFILKCNDSLPLSTEFSFRLHEIIWYSLEGLLKEKQSDLLSKLENVRESLIAKGIIWVSDILYFPEII